MEVKVDVQRARATDLANLSTDALWTFAACGRIIEGKCRQEIVIAGGRSVTRRPVAGGLVHLGGHPPTEVRVPKLQAEIAQTGDDRDGKEAGRL